MTMTQLTIMAAALVAPIFVAGPAIAQPVVPSAPYQTVDLPLITISANAEVDAAPDMATVGTGVQTRAATAREAVGQANSKTRELIDAIVKTGVARKDVQTSQISLNAEYDYNSARQAGGAPKFIGYQAGNQLTETVRDLKKLEKVIDSLVAAGATNLNGPNFGIADTAPLIVEAREKALKSARERAEFYAKASGYHSVRLVSISEGGYSAPRPYPMPVNAVRMEAAESAVVEPGQINVPVALSVQYVMER